MAETVRVGMLGIENSHSVAYTRLWQGDVPAEERVPGARVVACLNQQRTDQDADDEKKFLAQLQEMGVEKVVSKPEDMLGEVDAVAVVSRAGNEHLPLAEPFLRAGMPTFVDKPLATDLDVARKIVALARENNAPLFSASSVRYAPEVVEHRNMHDEIGKVRTGAVWCPASRDLGFYGIHAIEMMSALWGPGAKWVSAFHSEDKHLAWVGYEDGAAYAVHLVRYGSPGFGFTYLGEGKSGFSPVNAAYGPIARVMTKMFHDRETPLDLDTCVQSIAILEAFRKSENGKIVELASL
ncbi:MAG: Gfo/Idh/MocA family oxidoreductase [Armatimonadota bacterium]|nr:MAG: Gfo/Idh/MocA family oxidoreductase [Armatimonadota bacterium]